MVDKAVGYKLRSYWRERWEDTQTQSYRGNVHRDAAQLLRIAEDIGADEVKKLIDFYFSTKRPRADLMWFLYNYDKLQETLDEREKDREHRRKLREATIKRLKELDN